MDIASLDDLEQQHRMTEALLSKLENADGEAEQRPLVDELVTSLLEHMMTEETQVYPAVRDLDELREAAADAARQDANDASGA